MLGKLHRAQRESKILTNVPKHSTWNAHTALANRALRLGFVRVVMYLNPLRTAWIRTVVTWCAIQKLLVMLQVGVIKIRY